MLIPVLCTLMIAQGILNNADHIEENFHRVDRIVYAVKRTNHNLYATYSCQQQSDNSTTVNFVIDRRGRKIPVNISNVANIYCDHVNF